jgi:hypothetical protein
MKYTYILLPLVLTLTLVSCDPKTTSYNTEWVKVGKVKDIKRVLHFTLDGEKPGLQIGLQNSPDTDELPPAISVNSVKVTAHRTNYLPGFTNKYEVKITTDDNVTYAEIGEEAKAKLIKDLNLVDKKLTRSWERDFVLDDLLSQGFNKMAQKDIGDELKPEGINLPELESTGLDSSVERIGKLKHRRTKRHH